MNMGKTTGKYAPTRHKSPRFTCKGCNVLLSQYHTYYQVHERQIAKASKNRHMKNLFNLCPNCFAEWYLKL